MSTTTLETRKNLMIIELRKKDHDDKLRELRAARLNRPANLNKHVESSIKGIIWKLCSDAALDAKEYRIEYLLMRKYLTELVDSGTESYKYEDDMNIDLLFNRIMDGAFDLANYELGLDVISNLVYLSDARLNRYTQERLADFVINSKEPYCNMYQKKLIIENVRVFTPGFGQLLLSFGLLNFCSGIVDRKLTCEVISNFIKIAASALESIRMVIENDRDILLEIGSKNDIKAFGLALKICINNDYDYASSAKCLSWLISYNIVSENEALFDSEFITKLARIISKTNGTDSKAQDYLVLMYFIISLEGFGIDGFWAVCGSMLIPGLIRCFQDGNAAVKHAAIILLTKVASSCSDFGLDNLYDSGLLSALYDAASEYPQLSAQILSYFNLLLQKCNCDNMRFINIQELADYVLFLVQAKPKSLNPKALYLLVDVLSTLFEMYRDSYNNSLGLSYTEFQQIFVDKEIPYYFEELCLYLECELVEKIEEFLELNF